MTSSHPGIAILGSGFAALTAARELRRRDSRIPITLIAPSAEFVYAPSLIWLPTGLRQAADLRFSLDAQLARLDVRFVSARVRSLEDGGRTVVTDAGKHANDGLVIASGARFIKKLPGIEHALTICEGIAPAEKLRQRLLELREGTLALGFSANPAEPQAVRGGPMFELLFGVDTWLRRQGFRSRFELVFFSPAEKPGQRLGGKAVERLLAEMQRRGIRTHLGHKLEGFCANGVRTAGGNFDASLIAFMPGLTGPDWAAASGLPLSPGGFIQADAHCRVTGAERVYVAGDSGSYPGPDWLPKQAHMADLQARAAAANLIDEMAGRAPCAVPRPELICIVDSLDGGMLIYRDEKRNLMLGGRWLHHAKRFFEWHYLRPLR